MTISYVNGIMLTPKIDFYNCGEFIAIITRFCLCLWVRLQDAVGQELEQPSKFSEYIL